jgi:hypothetical protein
MAAILIGPFKCWHSPKKTGAGALIEVYISAEGVSIEALVIMGPVSLHRTHIEEGIAVNSEKKSQVVPMEGKVTKITIWDTS